MTYILYTYLIISYVIIGYCFWIELKDRKVSGEIYVEWFDVLVIVFSPLSLIYLMYDFLKEKIKQL